MKPLQADVLCDKHLLETFSWRYSCEEGVTAEGAQTQTERSSFSFLWRREHVAMFSPLRQPEAGTRCWAGPACPNKLSGLIK